MAYQNPTTYVESDPNGYITTTSTRATVAAFDRDADSWLYYDFGAAYFSGRFKHRIELYVTGTDDQSLFYPWTLQNNIESIPVLVTNNRDALYVGLILRTGTPDTFDIGLAELDGGTAYSDNLIGFSVDTPYYIEIERDETVGTYGTLYIRVYSDSAYTTLVDDGFVTLHTSKKDFQYHFAVNSYNNGTTGKDFAGYVENIDLSVPYDINVAETLTLAESLLFDKDSLVTDILSLAETIEETSDSAREDLTLDEGILVDREINIGEALALNEEITSASSLSFTFGVKGFPSGQTVEYRMQDDGFGLLSDWTATGVIESEVIPGKSKYAISGLQLENGFQGSIDWRIEGTKYYAVQFINYLDTWLASLAALPSLEDMLSTLVPATADAVLDEPVDEHTISGSLGQHTADLHDNAFGKWVLNQNNNTLTLFKVDGTALAVFDLVFTSQQINPVLIRANRI